MDKDKIKRKIKEIYIGTFYMFSLFSTTLVVCNILDYFNIFNGLTFFAALLFTIVSFSLMLYEGKNSMK